jgi:diguanylate cyclase (GGDEF)-like protein
VAGSNIGVIYLDREVQSGQDIELLNVFANQAAVAIHNAQLYEMATLDPLTGVYVRRFFEQCLHRELRTAFRSRQPLSLIMMDVDGMKNINDTAGHLAGDQALTLMGKGLHLATRSSDIVGRFGGDEFAVILPQTPAEGAESFGQRILDFLKDKSVSSPGGPIAIRSSIGVSFIEIHNFDAADIPRPVPQSYFQQMAQTALKQADEMLYLSKRSGGNQVKKGSGIRWQGFTNKKE